MYSHDAAVEALLTISNLMTALAISFFASAATVKVNWAFHVYANIYGFAYRLQLFADSA
jgi:hypothetical protein